MRHDALIRKIVIEDEQGNAFCAALLAKYTVHSLTALAAHVIGDPHHIKIELLDHAKDIVQIVFGWSAGVAHHGPLHNGLAPTLQHCFGRRCIDGFMMIIGHAVVDKNYAIFFFDSVENVAEMQKGRVSEHSSIPFFFCCGNIIFKILARHFNELFVVSNRRRISG